MSTNEKSLRIIENKGIFGRIANILKSVFNKEKNIETFSMNENVSDSNKDNLFSKFNNQYPNTKSKLLEIQEKLEKLGINRKNVMDLTKDLTNDEKQELFNLYKEQIKSYEKSTEYCKNKIIALKNKI